MRNLTVLTAALEIVEQRLCEPMNAADLAEACFVSYSGLQKLFAYALGCSVSEYITKRRLSRASVALLAGRSVTEVALEYQYSSPEAFSRAFRRVWGIAPSEFRKTRRFTDLHPKFRIQEGEAEMITRKPLDVSELYDYLKRLGGSYVLGIDIVNFMKINQDYGYAAGDTVIAETFARIEQELGDEMLLFRIGGDEFAVATAYEDVADAEALARKIVAKNGAVAKTDKGDVPFWLRVGVSRITGEALSYKRALEILYESVAHARERDDFVAVHAEGL
ncbi:MAG: helix-turn-helix domain-containing protein [Defluviitaleaceae bacterium]|nr:helix-turn-helix domain-containing protein [Defluviitaleaceae bacterium]